MIKTATLAFAATLLAAAPATAKPAAKFLKDAVQGDRSEMTLGGVIRDRGTSPQVRTYGATLVRQTLPVLRKHLSMAEALPR